MKNHSLPFVGFILLSTSASADILTVGGDSGMYAQISTAVAAAQDGDTILVDLETIRGSFSIVGKSLTIMPKVPGVRLDANSIQVSSLAPNQEVFLRGFDATAGTLPALEISNCFGSVRVQDCRLSGGYIPAVSVVNSTKVVFEDTVAIRGIPAFSIATSNVSLYSTVIIGRSGSTDFMGNGTPGHTALRRTGAGETFISGGSISGGSGGVGNSGGGIGSGPPGSNGPPGFGIESSGGGTLLLDCPVTGKTIQSTGLAGYGYAVLPGTSRTMDVRDSILDTKPIVLTFRGQPGDSVEFAFSTDNEFLSTAAAVGPLLVSTTNGSGFQPAGTIPASGELSATVHMGSVPLQEARRLTVQSRMTDLGGFVYFSNPSWIVIYDQCTGVVPIGSNYCGPAATNTNGLIGSLRAYGSDCANSNNVLLVASQIACHQYGLFLCSQGQGFVQNPGGSTGNLCLGGGQPIGRYIEPGQIGLSNFSDPTLGCYFQLEINLDRMPRPTPGYGMAIANQTWNFQSWYRDNGQSNFTDAVSILLR